MRQFPVRFRQLQNLTCKIIKAIKNFLTGIAGKITINSRSWYVNNFCVPNIIKLRKIFKIIRQTDKKKITLK